MLWFFFFFLCISAFTVKHLPPQREAGTTVLTWYDTGFIPEFSISLASSLQSVIKKCLISFHTSTLLRKNLLPT